jgi:hypothetical protein
LEDRGVPVEMIVYKGFGHGILRIDQRKRGELDKVFFDCDCAGIRIYPSFVVNSISWFGSCRTKSPSAKKDSAVASRAGTVNDAFRQS